MVLINGCSLGLVAGPGSMVGALDIRLAQKVYKIVVNGVWGNGGSSINHVDSFLEIFDPLPLCGPF